MQSRPGKPGCNSVVMFADKNAPYMLGAYAVFLGGMLIYVISLLIRARAAKRDEQRLDALEAEDASSREK